MKLKCSHCKTKEGYQLTRAAYDDMEYMGVHMVECKRCGRYFGVKFDGVYIRVAKK